MEARIEPQALAVSASRLGHLPQPLVPSGPSAFGKTLRRAKRTASRMRARRTAAGASASISALYVPPPEVERELAQAALAGQTLAAQGKELRFERTPDGRVVVELVDISGRPPDVIGPTGLFALLSKAA
jgi:hypothetical protein